MEELDGLGGAVRAFVASLPGETAVALLSLLALATLLRASRRVPLNSAFARRTGEKERFEDEAEEETVGTGRVPSRRARTLRRI